jgi:hypothetical protein
VLVIDETGDLKAGTATVGGAAPVLRGWGSKTSSGLV